MNVIFVFIKKDTDFIYYQIMTTRLTGGLYQGYKPKLPASA